MKIAIATLKSLSPYTQSRKLSTPKKDKESAANYEARVWRDRIHVNDDGFVFIPPMAFKFAIETAAKYLRMRIPGKDKSEFGKHFKSGVIVTEGPVLPIKRDDVSGIWLSLHANGKRGSGSRVDRCMPTIQSWNGDVTFYILDDTITKEVFEIHLKEAGNFIGIGQFRPENGGYHGRFTVGKITWQENE